MAMSVQQLADDHRALMAAAARAAGIDDPVAVLLDNLQNAVLDRARPGRLLPIDGVLIHDWDRSDRKSWPGTRFGARLYDLEGIPLARCITDFSPDLYDFAFNFFIVSRSNYLPLYRKAKRLRRERAKKSAPPVLPDAMFDTLRRNTLGYLHRDNLRRIRELGGRPRRGLLFSGPPGNGKTSACRWLWEQCHRLRYDYRIVTPDMYQEARRSHDSEGEVKKLFELGRPGFVFFDDMDIALRDRAASEGDDQSVFLGALDGIESKEGVVYIFTTNCPIDAIDPAFKRPGRIDLALQFDPPDAERRRRLFDRWHADIRAAIDIDRAVADTADWSYAEIDELKNLLILGFTDTGRFDWQATLNQWELNRCDLSFDRKRHLGFHLNGRHAHH